MANYVSITCICRNCGNEQLYSYPYGQLQDTHRAIATCNKCGFKSVYYGPDLTPIVDAIVKQHQESDDHDTLEEMK